MNRTETNISQKIKKGQKLLAVLFDPDKFRIEDFDPDILRQADIFLVGGSLIVEGNINDTCRSLKALNTAPVILFPGGSGQVNASANAILFTSLISGRNPEYLIGEQVKAAPLVKKFDLDVLPCGYMLIDGGSVTAVNYMSQTIPIPSDKPELAAATALAGEMMGMRHMYIETGSGALKTIRTNIITKLKQYISAHIWIGGGINSPGQAKEIWKAGADIIVVGTAIENQPGILSDFLVARHEAIKVTAGRI